MWFLFGVPRAARGYFLLFAIAMLWALVSETARAGLAWLGW